MAKTSSFRVVLTPDVANSTVAAVPAEWATEHAYAALDALPGEQYEAAFQIGDRTFGYYPADSAVLLNDLMSASNFVREGKRGCLTLTGYPVLFATVGRDMVLFGGPIQSNIFAIVPRVEVQRELDTALAKFWGAVSELPSQGPAQRQRPESEPS